MSIAKHSVQTSAQTSTYTSHQRSLYEVLHLDKLRTSFWLQCLFILAFALILFGPIANLLIWTVAET